MANNQSELSKPTWNNAVPVNVEKVLLELDKNKDVVRIRLVTDLGDITYKPKKSVIESSTISGIDTETQTQQLYTIPEILAEYQFLKPLSDATKKEPQEVTITYADIESTNEDTGETKTYKYMTRNGFESLYYEPFHKKDTSGLNKQKEQKKKYATV